MKALLPLLLVAGLSTLTGQTPPPTATLASAPKVDPDGRPFHQVKADDSLFTIANTYGISLNDLMELNHIQNNTITEGQHLYLAPPGSKVLPSRADDPAGAAANSPAVAPASPDIPAEQPSADFVASGPMDAVQPQMQPQLGVVLTDTKRKAAVPKASPNPVPRSFNGIIENPESDLTEAVTLKFRRSPILGALPNPALLNQILAPLPLLDTGYYRAEWTESQDRIAKWWERQIVYTLGFPRSAQWNTSDDGCRLVLRISPSASIAPSIQVIVPGSRLPAEIDGAMLRRMTSLGAPFRVLGHLIYLDGPGPVAGIKSGDLLSPWGIVAESFEIKTPAEGWVSITKPRASNP